MRHYLSFGGGVNSVALYLLMEKLGVEFEAVFVDHGGDWPETYDYVDYFVASGRPITILRPEVKTRDGKVFDNIFDYFNHLKVLPSKNKKRKYCTQKFKSYFLDKHQQSPCFVHIGYSVDEAHRAVISSKSGREYRWLLIEHEFLRSDCVDLIKKHGLDIPRKSGCFFCPYQGPAEYVELRRKHPGLFCKVKELEAAQNSRVTRDGKPWKPYYLARNAPLGSLVDERELFLPGLEHLEYPPCECGL